MYMFKFSVKKPKMDKTLIYNDFDKDYLTINNIDDKIKPSDELIKLISNMIIPK